MIITLSLVPIDDVEQICINLMNIDYYMTNEDILHNIFRTILKELKLSEWIVETEETQHYFPLIYGIIILNFYIIKNNPFEDFT